MPTIPLSKREALDIATFIVSAPLSPVPLGVLPERLPVLERRVSFEEVNRAIFHKTCWHCHSDPDFADGDGGPGNTGGFGFRGRGLSFATYSSIAAGLVDGDGERQSLFTPNLDGIPHLVAVLRARQAEEAGSPVPGLRGMPLGLPALTPKELQLVESWIEQGRPR